MSYNGINQLVYSRLWEVIIWADLFKSVKPAYIRQCLFDFLTKMTLDNQLTCVVSLNLVASKQFAFKVNGEVLFYVESLPLLFD